ncbi:uncharacterized protein LOC143074773 [Mytilus galloprovincialis]|uniref:uncharacterized protein LOC143074773 n=1 Tax=Mytilus galloprovincialis TaxID=29158 RepID=UPI003F7BAF55
MNYFDVVCYISVLVSTYFNNVQSCNCTEPSQKDLENRFNSINDNLNMKSLFMYEGWENSTLNKRFEELLLQSTEYRNSGTCPKRHMKTSESLSLRTSCPWFPHMDTMETRYPKTIYVAKTHCKSCITTDSLRNTYCKPLERIIKVLIRSNDIVNGICQYKEDKYNVPVAFVCTRIFEKVNDHELTSIPLSFFRKTLLRQKILSGRETTTTLPISVTQNQIG